MKIILVRHGLTEANMSSLYSLDSTKLHKSGFNVLVNTRRALEKYRIDKVYTSSLLRSQQTAKMLGFEDFTPDARINELDFGDFKGQSFVEVRTNYKDFFKTQEKDPFNTRYPNGESRMDLINRTSEFLDEISKKNENALCVSHGIAIKSCLFWILKDLSDWDSFWIENGAITVFDVKSNIKLIEKVNNL